MMRLLSVLTLLLGSGLSVYASNQDGPKASSVSVDNVPVSSDAVSTINAATSTAGANDESSGSSNDDEKPTKKKKSKKGNTKKSSKKKANDLPFAKNNVKCPKGLEDEDIKSIFKGYSYEGFIKASTDGDMDLMNGLMRKPWGFYKGHDGIHYAVYAFKPEATDMSNFVDTSKLAPYKMVRIKIPQYCALYTEASPDEANSGQHEPIGLVVSRASTHKPKPLDPGAVKVQAVYDILKKGTPVSDDNSDNANNDATTNDKGNNTDTSETKIFNKLDGDAGNNGNDAAHVPAGGDNSENPNPDNGDLSAVDGADQNALAPENQNANDASLDAGNLNPVPDNSVAGGNPGEDLSALGGGGDNPDANISAAPSESGGGDTASVPGGSGDQNATNGALDQNSVGDNGGGAGQ